MEQDIVNELQDTALSVSQDKLEYSLDIKSSHVEGMGVALMLTPVITFDGVSHRLAPKTVLLNDYTIQQVQSPAELAQHTLSALGLPKKPERIDTNEAVTLLSKLVTTKVLGSMTSSAVEEVTRKFLLDHESVLIDVDDFPLKDSTTFDSLTPIYREGVVKLSGAFYKLCSNKENASENFISLVMYLNFVVSMMNRTFR